MNITKPSLLPESPSRVNWLHHFPIFLISGLSLLIYSRGLNAQFVAEDFMFLKQFNTTFGEAWQLMLESSRIWPLAVVYRWFLYQLSSINPMGYHLASQAIHFVNVILVYILVNLLSKESRIGLGAALIFALYPRHHQPLLWMAAAQTPLSYMFALACLIGFVSFLRTKKISWYVSTIIALCMALMSQEGTVILFPLLVFIELFFLLQSKTISLTRPNKFPSLFPLIKYIPFLIIFTVYFALTFGGDRAFKLRGVEFESVEQLNSAGFSSGDAYHFKLGIDSIKEIAAYTTYAVFPHIPLRSLDPNLPSMLLSGITILLLAVIFFQGELLARLAVIWLFLCILPFVFFTPFGNADRYFYFISIGPSIIYAWLFYKLSEWLLKRSPAISRLLPTILFCLYALASIFVTQQRVNEWQIAGRIAENLLRQAVILVPDPEPESKMIYVGLPQQYKQAYVYTSAFSYAIQARYGDRAVDVSFYQTHDQQTVDFLKSAVSVENPVENLYVLLYEEGQLVDKSGVVSDLELLQPSSFFQW
jgi:hypothetical protein